MPTASPTRPASSPDWLALTPPAWLAARVEPWRLESASLSREGGVQLSLRSKRSRVPVLLELSGARLRLTVPETRVRARAREQLVAALQARLGPEARLRPWLETLAALARAAHTDGPASPTQSQLLETWRAWPTRECKPHLQLPARPPLDASALPRRTRAALIIHGFARGELLEALWAWEALPELPAAPVFVELHLELIALAVLGLRERALQIAAASEALAGDDPSEWLSLARAYEELGALDSSLRAHARVVALRGGLWDRLRMARTRGAFEPGDALRPSAHSSDAEKLSFAREAAKILEAAGRHQDLLVLLAEILANLEGDAPADMLLLSARLHLWRGESQAARDRLLALPADHRDGTSLLLEGIAASLEGQHETSLARLEEAERCGGAGLEALLWKAEALLELGRLDEALEAISAHILRENSLAAYLLKLHVAARGTAAHTFVSSLESRTFLDGLVRDVLPSLCEPQTLADAHAQPERFVGLTRSILDSMAGNRSAIPTWCQTNEAGALELRPIPVRPSGRDAAVAKLIRIRHTPPEQVLASFEPVADEYSLSPHPFTYRGEVLIWLGRYQEALACFAQGDARAPTRWSYVGRAATYELIGEAEQAEHWTQAGAERFGELESATTHVYRGERFRRLEQWEPAQRDLEIAVGAKPRRIGARMNLALVHHARANTAQWERELERLRDDAPAFLFEAGVRPDGTITPERLEACLTLMVGNRSSFLHSLIDPTGLFRVIPAPSQWTAHARLSVANYRRELGQALVESWLSAPEPRS